MRCPLHSRWAAAHACAVGRGALAAHDCGSGLPAPPRADHAEAAGRQSIFRGFMCAGARGFQIALEVRCGRGTERRQCAGQAARAQVAQRRVRARTLRRAKVFAGTPVAGAFAGGALAGTSAAGARGDTPAAGARGDTPAAGARGDTPAAAAFAGMPAAAAFAGTPAAGARGRRHPRLAHARALRPVTMLADTPPGSVLADAPPVSRAQALRPGTSVRARHFWRRARLRADGRGRWLSSGCRLRWAQQRFTGGRDTTAGMRSLASTGGSDARIPRRGLSGLWRFASGIAEVSSATRLAGNHSAQPTRQTNAPALSFPLLS